MTGRDLRRSRAIAGVKAYELAEAMGVHQTRISQIEALAEVTPEAEIRYLAALDACLAKTSQSPVEAVG